MTKNEATDACKQHAAEVQSVGAILALAGISFAVTGPHVEKGLGLPYESLAKALVVPQQQLLSAISEYVAVLENAAKGQLSPVEETWEEADVLRDKSFSLANIEIRATVDGLLVEATKSVVAYELLSPHGTELIDNALSRAVDALQAVLSEAASGKTVVLVDRRTTQEWEEILDN